MLVIPPRVLDRVQSRIEVDPDSGCHIWQRSRTPNGYGRITWHEAGKPVAMTVHRVIWIAERGEIPPGLDVDHRCHDQSCTVPVEDCPHRPCCNFDHLQLLTRRDNLLRGNSTLVRRALLDECEKGHPFTPENTRVRPNGTRECRICLNRRQREYNARKEVQLTRLGNHPGA